MITQEKWSQLSLGQQMGHVASEIARARHWQEKGDTQSRNKALERALELIDLTLQDSRWKSKSSDILNLRQVISDSLSGNNNLNTALSDLEESCMQFLEK